MTRQHCVLPYLTLGACDDGFRQYQVKTIQIECLCTSKHLTICFLMSSLLLVLLLSFHPLEWPSPLSFVQMLQPLMSSLLPVFCFLSICLNGRVPSLCPGVTAFSLCVEADCLMHFLSSSATRNGPDGAANPLPSSCFEKMCQRIHNSFFMHKRFSATRKLLRNFLSRSGLHWAARSHFIWATNSLVDFVWILFFVFYFFRMCVDTTKHDSRFFIQKMGYAGLHSWRAHWNQISSSEIGKSF